MSRTISLGLSGGGERITTPGEDLHEVVGQLTSSQVQTEDGMGESITLIDGDVVGDTISGVHDHTGGTTGAAYKERTAWMATYMAGMLKVSNMI